MTLYLIKNCEVIIIYKLFAKIIIYLYEVKNDINDIMIWLKSNYLNARL